MQIYIIDKRVFKHSVCIKEYCGVYLHKVYALHGRMHKRMPTNHIPILNQLSELHIPLRHMRIPHPMHQLPPILLHVRNNLRPAMSIRLLSLELHFIMSELSISL